MLDATAMTDDKIVLAAQGCPTQAIAIFDGDTRWYERAWRSGSPKSTRSCGRRFGVSSTTRIPPAVPRAVVDGRARPARRSGRRSREPGWLGLHVAEENGGAGYGLVEQAVVVEELGRACAPGPYSPR